MWAPPFHHPNTPPFHHPKRHHFITPHKGKRHHFITPLWKTTHRLFTEYSQWVLSILKKLLDVTEIKRTPMEQFQRFQDTEDRAYMTKFLIQVTLPHRQPSGDPEVWFRKNGNYSLMIRPGFVSTKDGFRRLGYPSGSIPRLLMLWLTREAVRKRDRRIQLGTSLPGFMQAIGLNPNNGSHKSLRSDRKRLHDQMTNLFQSQIRFDFQDEHSHAWKDLSVTSKGEVWWDFHSDMTYLFDSWIELGEYFYEAMIAAPVPLSMTALQALKNSSLSLDLYAWCVYATYTASKRGEPFEIRWARLHQNLGADYNRVRAFKAKAIASLQAIQKVYPELRLEEDEIGLRIRSSFTPIRPQVYVPATVTSLITDD